MASGLATGKPFARYHQQSQWHGHSRLLPSYMADVLFSCKDLFQRNLFGHYGCVNAIEFSNKGGAYLVSGEFTGSLDIFTRYRDKSEVMKKTRQLLPELASLHGHFECRVHKGAFLSEYFQPQIHK